MIWIVLPACEWYNERMEGKLNMTNKRRWMLLLCALLALWCANACAQTAEEMTQACTMRAPGVGAISCLADGDYSTRWSSGSREKARLEITAPEGKTIGSIYLQFYNNPCSFEVQVRGADGAWETAAVCDTDYLTGYARLPEAAQAVRIRPQANNQRLILAEAHVFGEGDAPEWVQRWQPPCEKADLLVISAHPDDELLFMGGTIPYYAGERRMAVQVAYLVTATSYRRLELLDGLWLCGVRSYPDLGTFPDAYAASLAGQYRKKGWSRERVLAHVAQLYRRYRPEVVVTHDVNGEYGHGAHRAAADAAIAAVGQAAQGEDGWAIRKLYLHLYTEGAMRMDWRVPLSAFGGRTAFDVAEAAFACHISQQKTDYRVEDFGPYDNACFGLAYSAVGEDAAGGDFFEHVPGFGL